ncbi:MAG: ABC transporter permease [Bacillota bacterium]|nr:ABC transporter permease [Bacillota bacterium]
MALQEDFKMALGSLRVNKLRSALTLLGIIIGVASVIVMISIGVGAERRVRGEVSSLGVNLLWVQVDWSRKDVRNGRFRPLTMEDVQLLQRSVPALRAVAPDTVRSYEVSRPGRTETATVNGTTAPFAEIRGLNVAQGRFLVEEDSLFRRRVAVLSSDLAEKLFGPLPALGQEIKVAGRYFTVVGVMEKAAQSFINDDTTGEMTVYLPIETMQTVLTGHRGGDVEVIFAQAASPEEALQAARHMEEVLRRKYGREYKYRVESLDKQLEVIGRVAQVFTAILAGIGSISLLVGGIGVMNIMLVSVAERTREVGIRKAVGAQRSDILRQFLIEAVVLCLVGGAAGIALGALGAQLVASLAKWPAAVTWESILLAAGFSTAVGIVFGVYPAYKAARLDPVEALKYE